MDLGGERMRVRSGDEERVVGPEGLVEAVEEMRKLSPGRWVEVRRLGLVRG